MFPASPARALPCQREPYIPMPQGRVSAALVVARPRTDTLRTGGMMNTPTLDVQPRRSRKLLIIAIPLAAVATLAVTPLLINIFERKQAAKNPLYKVDDLNDNIDDPAVWATNLPFQYEL